MERGKSWFHGGFPDNMITKDQQKFLRALWKFAVDSLTEEDKFNLELLGRDKYIESLEKKDATRLIQAALHMKTTNEKTLKNEKKEKPPEDENDGSFWAKGFGS